jgi:hypothetical protein
VVPAHPSMLRLARITASSMVGRLGFSYDEVEDVRLAVDELCWAITGAGAEGGSLTLVCTVLDEAVQFEGFLAIAGEAGATPVSLSSMTSRILDRLVDSYEVLPPNGTTGPGFRMVKRRA